MKNINNFLIYLFIAVVFLLAIISIVFVIPNIYNNFISNGYKKGKHEFNVNSVLPLNDSTFTYSYTLYNKQNLIGVEGLIDSNYVMSLIKAGNITNINYLKNITINISNKENDIWSYYNNVTLFPIAGNSFACTYNSSIIPTKKILTTQIYINQPLKYEKKIISDSMIEYKFMTNHIFICFNQNLKKALNYTGFNVPSSLIFKVDSTNTLYIIQLSALRGKPYKSFEQIIKYNNP